VTACPVAVPDRLRGRPRDASGLPVPWVSGRINGRAAFGVNDERLRCEAIAQGRCGQCGQTLGRRVAMIVHTGYDAATSSIEEPPMHEACARYALAVCPYLLHRGYKPRGSRRELGESAVLVPWALEPHVREAPIVLLLSDGYDVTASNMSLTCRPRRELWREEHT
jgi:hypothetical protein